MTTLVRIDKACGGRSIIAVVSNGTPALVTSASMPWPGAGPPTARDMRLGCQRTSHGCERGSILANWIAAVRSDSELVSGLRRRQAAAVVW
jgi:hypothetical protein